MTLNQRIKRIRQEKNLSQLELAKRIGMSQQTIANYEQSEAVPKMTTVKKLADALGVSEQYLLFGKDDNTYKESEQLNLFSFTDHSVAQNSSSDQKVETKEKAPKPVKNTIQFEYKDEVLPEEYSDFILMIKQFKSLNGRGRRKVLDYLHDITQLYNKESV